MRVLFFYGTGGGSPLLIIYFKRDYVQDKKRKEKLQHREPIAYNRMVFCLRSRDNHGKLLEDVFTSSNSWCLVFKDYLFLEVQILQVMMIMISIKKDLLIYSFRDWRLF